MNKGLAASTLVIIFLYSLLAGCVSGSPRTDLMAQFKENIQELGMSSIQYKNVGWKVPSAKTLPANPDSTIFEVFGMQKRPAIGFEIKGKGYFIKVREYAKGREAIIEKLETNLPKGSLKFDEMKWESPYTLAKGYRPLTDREIKDYAARKKIEALAIKKIGGLTLILYETPESEGVATLVINKQNELVESDIRTSPNRDDVPLSMVCDTQPVTVIINDAKLLTAGHKILAKFEYGYEITEFVASKRGHILYDEGLEGAGVSLQSIIVCDRSGKVLYSNHFVP